MTSILSDANRIGTSSSLLEQLLRSSYERLSVNPRSDLEPRRMGADIFEGCDDEPSDRLE